MDGLCTEVGMCLVSACLSKVLLLCFLVWHLEQLENFSRTLAHPNSKFVENRKRERERESRGLLLTAQRLGHND